LEYLEYNDCVSVKKGFTLIETLVIISILTLLTSFLILYSHGGERQIILLREKAKLISTILRAKSLSLNTLIEDEPGCGYGVGFEGTNYFIYKDLAGDCLNSDRLYSGPASGERLENDVFNLDPALKFLQRDISDVLFVPPDPQVFLDGGQSILEAVIALSTLDESSQTSIIINNAGQISSQ